MAENVHANSNFHQWIRSKGLSLWVIICFILFSAFYNAVLVREDRPPIPKLPSIFDPDCIEKYFEWLKWIVHSMLNDLGFYSFSRSNFARFGIMPTLILFVARIDALIVLPIAFHMIVLYLFTTWASPEIGLDQLDAEKDRPKPALHCMCIRIVTRGDESARPLVRRAVMTAVKLIKRMCQCEHLKVHLVTQTSFLDQPTKQAWIQEGSTEVLELVVPPNYKSKNGSLYKARNLCYWQDVGGVGGDCDESRSWILSLDEEAVITRGYLQSFIDDVLNSDIAEDISYALGGAIMDVHTAPISFINQMCEARWMAIYYAGLKLQPSFVRGALFFHGGAFFARAQAEADVGNDWGPKASVAEDFATGIKTIEKQVGIRYLDGWFIENTSPTVRGLIRQRARVLRGQIYCVLAWSMSTKQKFGFMYMVLMKNLLAFIHLTVVFSILYSPSDYMPAGPRVIYFDAMIVICVVAGITAYAFGGTYMSMSKLGMLKCILLSPFMVTFGAMLVEAISTLEAFWEMGKDWKRGSVTFAVTVKTDSAGAQGHRKAK